VRREEARRRASRQGDPLGALVLLFTPTSKATSASLLRRRTQSTDELPDPAHLGGNDMKILFSKVDSPCKEATFGVFEF
jgi:hypothetical protein